MYDAQIGRWGVIDPESEVYISVNPYAYVINNPLLFIDPDGRKLKISNNRQTAAENIAKIAATSIGNEILTRLIDRSETYTMESVFFTTSSQYDPLNRTASYVGSPFRKSVPYDGGFHNSMTASGHELMHAYDHSYDRDLRGGRSLDRDQAEANGVSFGNYLRDAYSLSPMREKYGGRNINAHGLGLFYGNEKISDFKELGSNKEKTSFGYSYTKTTKVKEKGEDGKNRVTKTKTTMYVKVDLDADQNATYKIFNNESDYQAGIQNW